MAVANLRLDDLLRQLRAQHGTTRKIRLAARYWRQIAELSAKERERVALAIGSQAAWKQLERLFLRDGTLSEDERAVQGALDRFGHADPEELRRWAQVLRHGGRKRVSDLVVTAVQAALEEEAEEIAVGGAPNEAASKSSPDADAATGVGSPPDAEVPTVAMSQPGAESLADPESTLAAATPVVATQVTTPGVGATASAAPVAREAAERPEASAGEPAPVADDSDELADAPEGEAGDAPEPPSVAVPPRRSGPSPASPVGSSRERLPQGMQEWEGGSVIGSPRARRTELSAVERLRELRALRENPAGVAAAGAAGRAELVARLGPGWAARRAVSEMIRSGAVAGVDEALHLIAGLDSAARRSWCLGVLVDHASLSARERDSVLEAAPSAAARRRLAKRCAQKCASAPA